ncbi:hypothetical protein [Kitasatospora camelliae]|uniref:Lipoprotein n=1 Tax=Kitasatospora camelliae TaxID=3156397 RepID=A0AAU8JWF8_9ACTN
MSSRKLLLAVVAATAALTLTACEGDGSDTAGAQGAPTTAAATSSAAAPSTAPTASKSTAAKPTAAKPTGGATRTADPSCAPKLSAGHKVVKVTKHATATQLFAADTVYECKMPDQGWWENGPEKTYPVAANAKAVLSDAGKKPAVPVAKLVEHLNKCLDGTKDTYQCDTGTEYEITVDGSGKVTAIEELWGPQLPSEF